MSSWLSHVISYAQSHRQEADKLLLALPTPGLGQQGSEALCWTVLNI